MRKGQLNRQHKMHHEIVVGSQQPVASNFLHSSPAIPRFGCSLPVCLVSQLMKAQGKELCVSGPVRACVLSAVEIYNQGKERKVILYPVPTQYCKVRYSTVFITNPASSNKSEGPWGLSGDFSPARHARSQHSDRRVACSSSTEALPGGGQECHALVIADGRAAGVRARGRPMACDGADRWTNSTAEGRRRRGSARGAAPQAPGKTRGRSGVGRLCCRHAADWATAGTLDD